MSITELKEVKLIEFDSGEQLIVFPLINYYVCVPVMSSANISEIGDEALMRHFHEACIYQFTKNLAEIILKK